MAFGGPGYGETTAPVYWTILAASRVSVTWRRSQILSMSCYMCTSTNVTILIIYLFTLSIDAIDTPAYQCFKDFLCTTQIVVTRVL